MEKDKPSHKGGGTKELVLDATLGNLTAVNNFLDALLDETSAPTKVRLQLELVVEEIFVNIASYAYGEKEGKAHIKARVDDGAYIEIIFMDEGVPYDPLSREDPDTTLPMDERRIGGLGIFLVKKNVDEVFYEHKDGKNLLTVRKKLA